MSADLAEIVRRSLGDCAAEMTVPVEAVLSAAIHTFSMLDDEQQVELVTEAMVRLRAAQACDAQTAPNEGRSGTTVVVSQERNQMRDDLVYRLMHERFDLVYAIAVRAADAPEGGYHHQWIMTPPRPDEAETPAARAAKLLKQLTDDLRHSKRRFEDLQRASEIRARRSA